MAWNFTDMASAEEIIEKIEDGEISNSATAYGLLGEIMNAFPGTWIADKAKNYVTICKKYCKDYLKEISNNTDLFLYLKRE